MNETLIKKYGPFHAVGTFICSHCVIESAKNLIGLEYPDILQLKTHDGEISSNYNEIAIKCLSDILKKNGKFPLLFCVDSRILLNHANPGILFLGTSMEAMGEEETKQAFADRIKSEILSLGLMKNKLDEDMSEDEIEHYKESIIVSFVSDVCVVVTPKVNKDDVDDLDIGYKEGVTDGVWANNYYVQVALYKMFKKKKIKNLDFLLEEIHNTIHGMDDSDFKKWAKNFKKYMTKKNKKEMEIEGDK